MHEELLAQRDGRRNMSDTQIVGVLVNALLIAAHTVRLTLVIPQWYKAEQNDEWRHDKEHHSIIMILWAILGILFAIK